MIVPTDTARAWLIEAGLTRDESVAFSEIVGYRDENGNIVPLDESHSWVDTDFLLQDCVTNECYHAAQVIKDKVAAMPVESGKNPK